jgi:protein O-mannosyl-transferase
MLRWQRLRLFALVSCLCIAVSWWPGVAAPYQYDDYVTPVKDPASQSLASFGRALPGTLRPLTKLTFAVESSLGAKSAPERRLFNAGLFLLTAALLAWLALELGLELEPSLALATLWACHPVHAETLLALAGRSVLVALFLTLLSAALLLRQRWRWALACAVLAVLARETAWAWLVACTGLVLWELRLSRARLAAALAAATTLGGVLVLASSRMRELLAFSFYDGPLGNRLGLQWAALPRGNLLLLFQPSAFTVDMDFSPLGWWRLLYVLGAFFLYGAAAWLAFRPRHSLAVRLAALLWLSLVVPLHSVVPKLDPLTARSFSASSAALVLLLAAALAGALPRHRRARAAFWLVSATLLLLVVPITRERAALYRDPVALWRDAAIHSKQSIRPLINWGTLLAQHGELEASRAALQEAVHRRPGNTEARQRLEAVHLLIENRNLLTAPPESERLPDHEAPPR